MNLHDVPAFATDNWIHVVVEAPRDSVLKLKYEPQWQAMSVSRPLPAGLKFPFDWGFIPSTLGPDGDPLDAMVMWDVPSYPGVVIPCRAIGVLQIEQNRRNQDPSERVRNDRILAIPVETRRERDVTQFTHLPSELRKELEQFAVAATALEGKDVRVLGWDDAGAALALVRSAARRT